MLGVEGALPGKAPSTPRSNRNTHGKIDQILTTKQADLVQKPLASQTVWGFAAQVALTIKRFCA